jgi:hypothetical protein
VRCIEPGSHTVALPTLDAILVYSSRFRLRRYPKHFKAGWPCRPLGLEILIGVGRVQPPGSCHLQAAINRRRLYLRGEPPVRRSIGPSPKWEHVI